MIRQFLRWLGLGRPSYEAAASSPSRRNVPGGFPVDERLELTSPVRSELVRRSRYLYRNSGFFRQLVADMVTYAVGEGIRPQSQVTDDSWAARAETLFEEWAARCEVTGRFSFAEVQQIVCKLVDVDGEAFVLLTAKNERPFLQIVEAHQVRGDEEGWTDGVRVDDFGAPVAYRVWSDDTNFQDVPASSVLHIYEPERASSVRGYPTAQHAIPHVIDEMELLALEKHAVKANADIAYTLCNLSGNLGEEDFTPLGNHAAPGKTDPGLVQQVLGGKVVALREGEKLEAHESQRPSPTFTGFLAHLRRDSALGVLPYEFCADASPLTGPGVRLVIAKADRRFVQRQRLLISRLIEPVWRYILAQAISSQTIEPVTNWWRISCTTPRRITVDAGREAMQNREDIKMGIKTLRQSFEEQGLDFEESLRTRARDFAFIKKISEEYGVPIQWLYSPAELTPPNQDDDESQQASDTQDMVN